MEVCREHDALTEKEIWALGEQLSENGDKGLITHLMETTRGPLCVHASMRPTPVSGQREHG